MTRGTFRATQRGEAWGSPLSATVETDIRAMRASRAAATDAGALRRFVSNLNTRSIIPREVRIARRLDDLDLTTSRGLRVAWEILSEPQDGHPKWIGRARPRDTTLRRFVWRLLCRTDPETAPPRYRIAVQLAELGIDRPVFS